MSWDARVVQALGEYKRAGFSFSWAWDEVMKLCPPKGSMYGRELFDDDGHPTEDRVSFMRRVCDDAWHDRRPALRDLPVLLEMMA